jgi:hypothetical protein
MTLAEAEQFFKCGHIVAVEEKVDGANLGISIDAMWQVVCQNRSHFVTAATHSQLSLWQRLMHRFSRRASHG